MDRYDKEILEQLIMNAAVEKSKSNSSDSLEATAEAFDVELSDDYIGDIKEKYPGFVEDPEEVLYDFKIDAIKKECNLYHSNGSKVANYSISTNFENMNHISTLYQATPSIFINKNTDRYTFLLLEDFEAEKDYLLDGNRTSLFVTEPEQGHDLEKRLKRFSETRIGSSRLAGERFKDSSTASKIIYHSLTASASSQIARVTVAATMNPAIAISLGASMFIGSSIAPYIIGSRKEKKLEKEIREIKESIEQDFIQGDDAILYIGNSKPYDPEIILRGLTIAEVMRSDYQERKKRER